MNTKSFVGVRLRRIREEKGLTQAALARALGISPSYLNQIERNRRPLTAPVLLRLTATLGVDAGALSDDEEARLVSGLHEAFSDLPGGESVSLQEVKELAASMPEAGRAMIALHRRLGSATDRLDEIAATAGAGAGEGASSRAPHEQVCVFFHDRRNHFPLLDRAAESLASTRWLTAGAGDAGLEKHLAERHDVRVVVADEGPRGRENRRYDARNRLLTLSRALRPGQRAFQMAAQIAFLEHGGLLSDLVADDPALTGDESRALARVGLAHYFAGAVVLPYGDVLKTAERARYDIEVIGRRFGVGFETVCHRLSTLGRSGNRGVPFAFVRVDRAGIVSKRLSATDLPFGRAGGGCPLWIVYEAFSSPGRILTQLAQMPDGRTGLWIARTVTTPGAGYGAPDKTFAVGLGCDVRHAARLVYSAGLTLGDPAAATPIGPGCAICERPACPQRAVPPIGRPLMVDENRSRFEPYRAA